MAALVKTHLVIKNPSADENERVDMSMKRKAEDLYEDVEQKPAKVGYVLTRHLIVI